VNEFGRPGPGPPDLLGPRQDAALRLGAPIARANPVAKLAASSALAFGLVLSVDAVTAGVALVLEAATLPWCGVSPRAVLRRGAVVIAAGLSTGVAAALFGVDRGVVLAGLGPVTLTSGSLAAGAAIALRVLAIGLPGVVLLGTTDPTDLADGLAQVLHLPPRFTLSSLAALRLFAVLADDWRSMSLARRARGMGRGGWGGWRGGGRTGRRRAVIGAVVDGPRLAFGQIFGLLVIAIRRATVLATAMEARGLGAGRPRTWSRPSRLGRVDLLLMLGAVVLVTLAVAAGLAAGTWELVLS
jgi:energy-coupling factor transport system permease protein